MKRIVVFIIVIGLLASGSAFGQTEVVIAIDRGETWLTAAETSGGQWGKRTETLSAALAIRALNIDDDVSNDISALASHSAGLAHEVASMLLGTQDSGFVSSLQSWQNPNGSYGATEGENLATTGLAVLAHIGAR